MPPAPGGNKVSNEKPPFASTSITIRWRARQRQACPVFALSYLVERISQVAFFYRLLTTFRRLWIIDPLQALQQPFSLHAVIAAWVFPRRGYHENDPSRIILGTAFRFFHRAGTFRNARRKKRKAVPRMIR